VRQLSNFTVDCLFGHTSSLCVGMDGGDPDKIRLIDEQTFEVLDTFTLLEDEMACSVSRVLLKEDDRDFFAVGTAFTPQGDLEPSSVSLYSLAMSIFSFDFEKSFFCLGSNSPFPCLRGETRANKSDRYQRGSLQH